MTSFDPTDHFFQWLLTNNYNPATAYQYAKWPKKLLEGVETPMTPELLLASLQRYKPSHYSIAQAGWRAYRTYCAQDEELSRFSLPDFPSGRAPKPVVAVSRMPQVDRLPMRRFLKQLGVPAKDLHGLRWGHVQAGVRATLAQGSALPLVTLLYGDGKRTASLALSEVLRYREWAWPTLAAEDRWPVEEAPLFPEMPESLVPLSRGDLETLYSLPLAPEDSASLPFDAKATPRPQTAPEPAQPRFSSRDLLSKL